jgi:hypothetical protein
MSLTPNEAAQTLRDVQSAERRSRQAYSYSLSAPHFIMWGIVWMLGYSASAFAAPRIAGFVWPALILAAVIGGFVITHWQHGGKKDADAAQIGQRFGATIGIIYAFSGALYYILMPTWSIHDPASFWTWHKMIAAYWPLLFSAIYGVAGIWAGLRYGILGAFVAIATMAGYSLINGYLFYVWMAAVGGGALILTGLWMRKA